jgi:hypothetical protein
VCSSDLRAKLGGARPEITIIVPDGKSAKAHAVRYAGAVISHDAPARGATVQMQAGKLIERGAPQPLRLPSQTAMQGQEMGRPPFRDAKR